MDTINQKEYLKKYLGIGRAPGEKKKKKKIKGTSNRVKIIDDDAEANFVSNIVEEDPLQANEYAPQIVAIIDERPPSLRVDEKTKNPLWQPIGATENSNVLEQRSTISGFKIAPPKQSEKSLPGLPNRSYPDRKKIGSNNSSPRKSSKWAPSIKKEDSIHLITDDSPPRRLKNYDDNSPPRKVKNDYSPPRRIQSPDNSPPRKSRNYDNSPPRKLKNVDSSSPRKRKSDDNSPPRKSKKIDNSPPRKMKNVDNSPPRKSRNYDHSLPRKLKNIDSSPPRKTKSDDNSPPRKSRNYDNSPPRKTKSVDNSPAKQSYRSHLHKKSTDEDSYSPQSGTTKAAGDNSPPRKETRWDRENKKDNFDEKSSGKMEKTLDGKRAGLQNAHQLVEESKQFRSREDQLFKNLSKEVSGENAETVFRDRSSGKKRNFEEEDERQRKKREEEAKNKEKYSKWGRGLVQVESREQKLQEELHEMSKPLARYADDEDLEKFLKQQEREGDPMLAYIRKKRRKKAAEEGVEIKPQFEGQFLPNRYGIKPGHRWDGVDRSNGYEKKWFEVQNAKRAQQEDVYRWSTEDM